MSGAPIRVKAYAKVNLTLDVLSRRDDGFHELESIMARIALHDTITLTPATKTSVSYLNVPTPKNDIVRRAVEAYAALSGFRASVDVVKRIPMQAGLGGGSADAAAVLCAMQEQYHALNEDELNDVALGLGADVPFCMQTLPCLAGGVGELLKPVYCPSPLWLLIVKPSAGISTAELFGMLKLPAIHRPNNKAALQTLTDGDIRAFGKLMCNALEPAATELLPEIGGLIERLFTSNAIGACMTGSGSAVMGLYENRDLAQAAAKNFCDADFYTVTSSLV